MSERSIENWGTLSAQAHTQLLLTSPEARVTFIKKLASLAHKDGNFIFL